MTLDCYAPVVSKDANPSFVREYAWTIDKNVSPIAHSGKQGDTFSSSYTVTVSRIVTESDYMVDRHDLRAGPETARQGRSRWTWPIRWVRRRRLWTVVEAARA